MSGGSMKVLSCIFLVFLLSGCASPPPPAPPVQQVQVQSPPPAPVIIEKTITLQPLTAALVRELDKFKAVPFFQYYISNPVVLISDNPTGATGSNRRGTLELDNDFAKDIIVIDAKTKGEVVNIREDINGKIVLEVCFEPGDSDTWLSFTESGSEGYFDLEADEGVTLYGGMRYLVQTGADKMTRLLINIENTIRPTTPPRVLPGRDIEDDKANTPMEFQINPPVSRQMGLQEEYPAEQEPGTDFFAGTDPVTGDELYAAYTNSQDLSPGPGLEPAAPEISGGQDNQNQKLFKVQVGAYRDKEIAQDIFDSLSADGFSPVYERNNDFYRVVITGVTAGDLDDVTQRLQYAGFSNPWIREDD